MVTKEQLIARYRHELGGIVLDATAQRDATARSMWLGTVMSRIDTILGNIYHELERENDSEIVKPATAGTGGRAGESQRDSANRAAASAKPAQTTQAGGNGSGNPSAGTNRPPVCGANTHNPPSRG